MFNKINNKNIVQAPLAVHVIELYVIFSCVTPSIPPCRLQGGPRRNVVKRNVNYRRRDISTVYRKH